MAFQNPFPGLSKPLDDNDLVRALRLDLAAEEEATFIYTAHADACRHPAVRKALNDIANEERVHAGEFLRLIQLLTHDEPKFQLEGYEEVDKVFEALSPGEIKEVLATV